MFLLCQFYYFFMQFHMLRLFKIEDIGQIPCRAENPVLIQVRPFLYLVVKNILK